jgi:hypothetical protein
VVIGITCRCGTIHNFDSEMEGEYEWPDPDTGGSVSKFCLCGRSVWLDYHADDHAYFIRVDSTPSTSAKPCPSCGTPSMYPMIDHDAFMCSCGSTAIVKNQRRG